jgi:prevent-host-death family protein
MKLMQVNIHEAKTNLSRLIEAATAGQEVTIAKAGKPVARLVRLAKKRPVLGSAAGTIEFTKNWEKPMTAAEADEFLGL